MAGILKTLRDAANRVTYEGVGLHVVPRGLTYPIDFGGLGQIRFGEKEGSTLPLIRPDNRFTLDEDAIFGTDQIVIATNPKWLQPGGFVTVGERESHAIDDVNESTIFLTTDLLADYVVGQYVYHYSNPIQVEGTYLKGTIVINVDSTYFMVRGDVIAVPRNNQNVIVTFDEYSVINTVLAGVVNGVYQYQLTLDRALSKDITENQIIQLRAYPAYKSPIKSIPTSSGVIRRISGPFLVDWPSSVFRQGMEVDETQTIFLYNSGRVLIEEPRVVEKNDHILLNPIRADQFLFWQKVEGSINYDGGVEKFVMTANGEGHWRLKYECIPKLTRPIKSATGFISFPPKTEFINNETFTLDDTDTQVLFEYMVSGSYVPTPSSAATGSITVTSIPSDNQWVTIDDGFGHLIDFEFKRTVGYVKNLSRYTVDVTSAVILADVAIIIREFLEGIVGFRITPSALGVVVALNHNETSTKGNQPIVIDGTLLWPIVGMSGGTIKVATIDISATTTALEVAQLSSAAITAEEMFITPSWPAIIPVAELTTTIPGATANIPIVDTVTSSDFVVNGMSGGSGGFKWNVTLRPQADALMRVRFYPNDWQDFNLPAGIDTSISIEILATDEEIEMIDMLIKTDPDTEVLMGQWNISGPRVGAIHYEYISRVRGDYNAASATMILKPIWQSLDDLRGVHDQGFTLDNGYVRL